MTWTILYSSKAEKQYRKLPAGVQDRLDLLTAEMELSGPIRHNWKNYSKIEGRRGQYHCHIKTGRPTYVAVWEVVNEMISVIEVIYAGTHEKAPY